jgi:nicotinate-nucleotide adenylyltransferase
MEVVNVAVFGGSFNPPHIGHVLAIAYVLATSEVDRLVVVPASKHPFGKPLAPFEERVRMCELATAALSGVTVSRVEEDLDGLTLHMLEALAREHPDWKMRLVIGADILLEADKWFRFDDVRRLAPPIVLGRKGVPRTSAPDPVLPEVSSTVVRELLAGKRWDALAPIVPRAVLEHIRARGLYG